MTTRRKSLRHIRPVAALLLSAAGLALGAATAAGATLEYLSGAKLECKVLAKDATSVTVEVTSGGMVVKRTIPLSSLHAVTINDKRYVLNERPSPDAPAASGKAPASAAKAAPKSMRPRAEIEALINEQGRTPPDWFEATPLKVPPSLDLSWPEKPDGQWNNQKNVGQYVWDIINPNANKWREGVRLMHHLLTLHKDDAEKRVRIMNSLGQMYHNLHADYPRAAFWWRQAGVDKSPRFPGSTVHLAECYWRLGNQAMAVEILKKRPPALGAIKLWADMGETKEALALAESYVRSAPNLAHECYLHAADACRLAGRYDEALKYYDQVLAIQAEGNAKGRVDRAQQRARASRDAIELFELLDVTQVADGSYQDQAQGYEGPVRVAVSVRGGRIESVAVIEHKEKQYYASMTDTPAKIIAKQGVKGVDATSSATITSEAIINATAQALAGAARKP